jgi:hypothetical protein
MEFFSRFAVTENGRFMRKVLMIVMLLLCGALVLQGQVTDSTSLRTQGRPAFETGKSLISSGAATAAVGGGLILLAMSPALNPYREEFSENMLAPMVYILGLCTVMTGASICLAGIPVTVTGYSIMQSDGPWRDLRYNSRGPGIILEGQYLLPDVLQARAAFGYHFSPHVFLGGGIAPGFWLDKSSRYEGGPSMSLPVYADFRWTMCNRLISPYLGLSAGMELADPSPYLGAEFGTRIHMSRASTRSFWSALSGEVAGGYARAGIKMGYSF